MYIIVRIRSTTTYNLMGTGEDTFENGTISNFTFFILLAIPIAVA